MRRPGDNGNLDSGALEQAGLIRSGKAICDGIGEGALEQPAAGALRSLGKHNALPRDGGGDDRSMRGAVDLLDCVDRGHADDRGPVLCDGVDRTFDGCGVDERPRSIMDEYDIVLPAAGLGSELLKCIPDGLLADISARDDVDSGSELKFIELLAHAFDLALLDSDVDGLHARNREECP